MMASPRYNSNEMRRQVGSPRPKGGRDTKDTPCRNILIYGHCRYEDQGCTFNHDQSKNSAQSTPSLKPDATVWTPSQSTNNKKNSSFTSQALNAASFTPKGTGGLTPSLAGDVGIALNPATSSEFTPYNLNNPVAPNGGLEHDAFSMSSVGAALQSGAYNMFSEDHSLMQPQTSFFGQPSYTDMPQQPAYHLYAPAMTDPPIVKGLQRLTHQFFIPNNIREDLTKKAAQSLLEMQNLPNVGDFHGLAALDTTNSSKHNPVLGHTTWVYKATSSKTGQPHCLRRLAGYTLSNANAIRKVNEWKGIRNANVVTIWDAFTNRSFGEPSLVFVYSFHSMSRTLMEVHFNNQTHSRYQRTPQPIPEPVLWSYISQIANALRSIHSAGLAARYIDLTKVILTDKNHIRLSACGILDVIQYEMSRPIPELQQDDFAHTGRVILALGTNNTGYSGSSITVSQIQSALSQMQRFYSPGLVDVVYWLLAPAEQGVKGVDELLARIAPKLAESFDSSLNANDNLTAVLQKELENSRAARMMIKLNVLLERPEYTAEGKWAENQPRYLARLFRDYVFHQVDANNNPGLNLGHILGCLNKLDAGTDEKICLSSPDNQTVMVITYSELKKQIQSAFNELTAAASKSQIHSRQY